VVNLKWLKGVSLHGIYSGGHSTRKNIRQMTLYGGGILLEKDVEIIYR
jgi:hypothetical protein